MATVYSHSRISSFENCPKQFHFRYVLKIPRETEGIEAFVGKRVHEILERLYNFVRRDQLPSIEKVLQRYRALWDENFDEDRVRIVREGTPVSFYVQLGERCLRNYYNNHYPFDGDETLGVEERVHFQLDPAGRYRMQGVIDRIARSRDGAIEIQDYKTGQRVPAQRYIEKDRQLALYQIGLSERFGGEPVRLVWHYLAPGHGQTRTSARSPEQLDQLKVETCELIDRIESETEWAPKKIPLCDWCEYKSMCPAWGNDLEAVSAPASPGASPPDGGQLNLL